MYILLGREIKKIPSSSVENVATAIVEACCHTLHGSVSMPDVFRGLDMACFTAEEDLRRVLHFYHNKIKTEHSL